MISEYENNNKCNNDNNLSRSSLVGSVLLLLDLKASVQIPGQSSSTKRNNKNIFPVT